MDIEDRIREAIREDQLPEPSVQFHGRVMAGIADGTHGGHGGLGMFRSFSGLLRFAFLALALVLATAAIGLPFMLGRPGVGAPDGSAEASGFAAPTPIPTTSATASAEPSIASARPSPIPKSGVPTYRPIAVQSPSPWFVPTASPPYLFDSATLLTDGRVLFAGGYDYTTTTFLSQAHLYDPATGKFGSTGSMATARAGETVTRLTDGRVLFVGGLSGNYNQLASAEMYDPATGKFSPTGSLATARQFHTATLLRDGRVLVAGGYADNPAIALLMAYHPGSKEPSNPNAMTLEKGQLASAELYDPATGKFAPTGSMTEARDNFTSVLLADGRVLIFGNTGGGDGGDPATDKTAEVYDPATGKFARTGSLNAARINPHATLLADGRVLVTDGANDVKLAELYDPKTGKFTLTGSLNVARGGFAATLLSDGRVLIAGGGGPFPDNASSAVELYDPSAGKFTLAGSMTAARETPTGTLLADGRVLIAGGTYDGPDGWVGIYSAELYQP
jgi:hypothetical protein